MFPAETYRARRAALKSRLDGGVALFLGNAESPLNYADNHYPYRQDSTFLYFFGLSGPDLAGVVDLDSGEEILFGHTPTIDEIVWTGPLPTVAERAERVGVRETRDIEGIGDFLAAARAGGRRVHLVPPYRGETKLELMRLFSVGEEGIRGLVSDELVRAVIALRSVKTPEELAEIEKALEVSRAMHVRAMEVARPGLTEEDVVREVLATAAAHGAELSFPLILSVRGEVLHNHGHGNTMADGDLVVHDSGVQSAEGYASDITRTFPVSGRFDDRQREIYELVLAAHETALATVGPGVSFRSIYDGASVSLLEGLRGFGVFRGDAEEAVARGAHALVFQCGCGHMVGLDVHDMENLGEDLVGYDETVSRSDKFGVCYLRLGRELQPGWVVAVEPGIYFIPELMDLWRAEGKFAEYFDYEALAAFKGFGGIRIEDDVVITDAGAEVLGLPIPKTVEEIETIMDG